MTGVKRRSVLDGARIAAALLVAAGHIAPLSMFGETADDAFTSVFGRIAVPFFLMLTGYFTLGRTEKFPARFCVKTAAVYGATVLLYIPVNVYAGHFTSGVLPAVRALFFEGTMYHLWYLPASLLGVAVTYLLLRRTGLHAALAISVVLYVVGLLGDSYYGLVNGAVAQAYDALFAVTGYTRNGLFYAPLFLVLGVAVRTHGALPRKVSAAGFTVSYAAKIAESAVVRELELPRHDSMYVFLPVAAFFLFNLLLTFDGGGNTTFRRVSAVVYLIHPMALVLLRGFAKLVSLQWILVDNTVVCYVAVCALSLAVAFAVTRLTNRGARTPSRAWIEIDAYQLRRNLSEVRRILPETCAVMAVVKANAYGHGAVAVARLMNREGVCAFCVATVDEGIELRKKRIRGEILILGYTHTSRFGDLRRYRLTQTVVDSDYAAQLAAYGKRVRVHVKLDTGLHRYGERAENVDAVASIFAHKNMQIDGIFTHLRASDSTSAEAERESRAQIDLFYATLAELKKRGIAIPKTHIQSSYGALNYTDLRCDYARIGVALYGAISRAQMFYPDETDIRPALTVKARVASVKTVAAGERVGYGLHCTAPYDMRIAVVTAGYADGVPRGLSDGTGYVAVNGCRATVVGKVCMDATVVDVTDAGAIEPGSVAEILGGSAMNACEMAAALGSVPNEVLSRLGSRFERV